LSDLRRAVALIFRLKGKEVLTRDEIVLSASMDHQWFSPKDAEIFFEVALKAKLLAETEGGFKPTFNVSAVNIPIDFSPSPGVLSEEEVSTLLRLVEDIAESAQLSQQEVFARINRKQEEMNVEIGVAALLTASELNVPVGPYLEDIKREVMESWEKG